MCDTHLDWCERGLRRTSVIKNKKKNTQRAGDNQSEELLDFCRRRCDSDSSYRLGADVEVVRSNTYPEVFMTAG